MGARRTKQPLKYQGSFELRRSKRQRPPYLAVGELEALLLPPNFTVFVERNLRIPAGARVASLLNQALVEGRGNAKSLHALLQVLILAPAPPRQRLASFGASGFVGPARLPVQVAGVRRERRPRDQFQGPPELVARAGGEDYRLATVLLHVAGEPGWEEDCVNVHLDYEVMMPYFPLLYHHLPDIHERPRIQIARCLGAVHAHFPLLVVQSICKQGCPKSFRS
mmetsp:Transcript_11790/g.24457  ORF Transcript_11790/g.24457 Transcript_11790/m.24457 type:complete len:223 (-) Transcript_11790:627-1295(-)